MENVKSKFINNKKVVIFIAVILLILLIFVIIPMAKVSTMRKEMENYELMEYAEVILEPKIGTFSCSCGDRTNIEMVFRVPREKAADISVGETEDGFYRIIVDSFFSKDRREFIAEKDCTYVYNESEAAKYGISESDEGYVYYHVVIRRNGSGFTDHLMLEYNK